MLEPRIKPINRHPNTFTIKVARGNEVDDNLSIKIVNPYRDIAPRPPPIPTKSRFIL